MTPEVWYEVVTDSVIEIADKQRQIDLWLNGKDNRFSSPTEAYATLFSEADLEGFLVDKNIGLSTTQRSKGLQLEQALDAYFSKYSTTPSSSEEVGVMIDDPEWEKVRQVAREFLGTLNSKDI